LEEAALKILESDIRNQLNEIEVVYRKIDDRKFATESDDQIRLESLGYQLHNLYSTFEDLFSIIATFFENSIDDPSRWHVTLLQRMQQNIPGIRPALLSNESFILLSELRAFRHVFRHAYSRIIERERLDSLLEKAFELRKIYKQEVEAFLKLLYSDTNSL